MKKTDRRFRYFGLARASQVTAKATILYGTWRDLQGTFPIRSQIFTIPNSLVISKSPNQVPNRYRFRNRPLWYAKKAPVYEHENTNPCGTTGENNQNMSSRKMWGPTCPVFILPYPANDVSKTVTILLSHIIQYKCIYNNYKL